MDLRKRKKLIILLVVLFFIIVIGFGISYYLSTRKSSENVLRVGMEVDYAPYNYGVSPGDKTDESYLVGTNGSNYADGYDVRIAKAIAKQLGRKLVIVKKEWDGLIPALNNEKIDLIVGGMAKTERRAQQIDFTDPYFNPNISFIVHKDNPQNIQNIGDLQGKKLGVQTETLYEDKTEELAGGKANVEFLPSYIDLIDKTRSQHIVGFIAESSLAQQYLKSFPDILTTIDNIGTVLYQQMQENKVDIDTRIGVKKNNPLLGQVNEALRKIDKNTRKGYMQQAIQIYAKNQN
ncbi:MAG: transporter substrate-binding domain-containing protein [Candidatus Phytoplasma pruni]|uniref:transporter substrate-binding domain-containing protein n=1 Tax=Milkweed yellows phytoplasma TaxID=208434 RepID=UPI000371E42F|nr:transporter substrate-binding domain-containing protein [Milkweed yellows phytoplasma]